MNNFLKSLFEDNSGGTSSSRLVVLLWTVALIFVFVFTSVYKKEVASFDNSIITIYLGVVTCKTIQRFGEKSKEDGTEQQK
jgi:hypothetical protein